jgi:hypothetical protein
LSLLWLLVAGAEGGAVSPALQEKLSLLFSSSDGGGVGHAAGSAESHTPVSRNRVWRMVNSLAVCTDTSQSRHRIARSSLQNRSPPLLLHDIENRFRTQESIELWQPRLS